MTRQPSTTGDLSANSPPPLTHIRLPDPSSCSSCKIISEEIWIQEGLQMTLTKRSLCTFHIPAVPTTAALTHLPPCHSLADIPISCSPLPSAAIQYYPQMPREPISCHPLPNLPTLPDMPEADATVVEMLLNSDVYDGTLPTDRAVSDAITKFDSSVRICPKMKTRKRTSSIASIESLEEKYNRLLELCRQKRISLREAFETIQGSGSRANFYSQRYIVDLMIVDREKYQRILLENPKASLKNLSIACREHLGQSPWKEAVAIMKKEGLLLY